MKPLLFACLLLAACASTSPPPAPAPVEEALLGDTVNVHRAGSLWFAGQPTEVDVLELKARGFDRVITLRTDGEVEGFDERAAVEIQGIAWENPAYRLPDALTDEFFDGIRGLLREHREEKVLFHCGSANRVGAVWLPYRVLDEGVPLEQALEEAHTIGLRSPQLEEKALAYVKARN